MRNEVEMTDNELYLSPGMVTTLRRSVDNQYINCADMDTVWNDFGEWEVAPEAFVLQDIIGHGHYGIVWRGKWNFNSAVKVHTLDIAPLRSESPPQKRSGMARVLKGFHSFTCTPTRSSAIGMSHTCFCLPSRSWYSAGTVYPVWLKKQQP